MKEINNIKLSMEVKTKVELLDDLYPTERILAIRFFKNLATKYSEDFVNRVLEGFSVLSGNNETVDYLYMEDGDLFEEYNGKSYMIDGDRLLAHKPLQPELDRIKDIIDEAIYDYYL